MLDGVTYPATVYPDQTVQLAHKSEQPPRDDRFSYDEQFTMWSVRLPMADCEQVYSVSSRARYQGHLCQVIAIDAEGNALLYYLEGDRGTAEELGFEQVDPGTHAKTVPVSELHGYYEERRDLKFKQWREETFPRATAAQS